ncbi:ABC transporter ATP-binding protein [Microbacteriaceae bacterium 4G12]
MSVLHIESVCKEYKDKIALAPFSLQAEPGECIVLCGGNGAGKSTLLHILAGISKPSKGTVLLQGMDIQKQRKKYITNIGYMPDEFPIQETMGTKEFLTFYASLRKVSQERVKRLIQMLGLEEKKHEKVKALSKGMRQRLLFGQACLGGPALLLLDEPTNGLDPYWMNVFVQMLQDMKEQGTIIIFSTHMMDIAAEIGDRVFFMEEGKVVKVLNNERQDTTKFTLELLQLHRTV